MGTKKTVTRVKDYEDGKLTSDVTTTVVQVDQPKPDEANSTGFYL